MAGVISLAIYPADDPLGSALVTLTDEDVSTFEMRKAQNELGSGTFSIRRDHAEATPANLAGGNYCVVTIPQIDADPIFGFWLDKADDTILARDEEGNELLTRGGPGTLAILRNALLLDDFYNGPLGGTDRGNVTEAGYWTWTSEPYGAILVRLIEEGQLQPGLPLDDVTIDFTRTSDSASDAWPDIEETIQFDIGTDGLTAYERLVASGFLFVRADPDLSVHAYGAQPGTDRSSGTFASGKVRFVKGTNIETELVRSQDLTSHATHALVRGKNLKYRQVVSPDWSAGEQARWIPVDYPESNDNALLDNVGDEELARLKTLRDAFEFEMHPGDTPLSGLYLPFKHFDIGDTIRVHTGTDPYDYNEVNVPVVGIRITLNDATDDSTPTLEALSLHFILEVGGSKTGGMLGTGGGMAHAFVEDSFFTTTDVHFVGGSFDDIRFKAPYAGIGATAGTLDVDAWMLMTANPGTDSVNFEVEVYNAAGDFASLFLGNFGFFGEGNQVVFDLAAGNLNDDSKFYINDGWGLVVTQLAAEPGGAQSEQAQLYFDTALDALRLYANGAWSSLLTSATVPPPFVPVVGYAECNSPPTTDATPNNPSAVPFDTFYDVDGSAGSLPAGLALTYSSGAFTATEDGVWNLSLGFDPITAPGSAGNVRIATPDYGYSPLVVVQAAANPSQLTLPHTLRLKTGDSFSVDQANAGASVQQIDAYALLGIIRLAEAVA